MKKITILITLMITSLGFSQTPVGTWKLSQVAGALAVGPVAGSGLWWTSGTAEVSTRACLFDDEYVFNADGSFQNVLQGSTWLETWQAAQEACGTPVAPHNGSTAATWEYSSANKTIKVTGKGAFLGLAKVNNGVQLASPASAPVSITYTVTALTATNMTIDIMYDNAGSPGWWRFLFTKKLAGQPVIGALSLPPSPITVGDVPFELVDPTSDSSGAFTYTSSNPAVATITDGSVFMVGPGTTTITASQAASGNFIAGSVSNELFVYAAPPTVSAPDQPARNAADVISIFSDAYANNLPNLRIGKFWGQQTVCDDVDPGNGDKFKRMVKFNYQGVEFNHVDAAFKIDVSVGYKLHIDINHTSLTPIEIYLISPGQGQESKYTITPISIGWKSYDIDVNTTNFPIPVLTNIIQIKLVNTSEDLITTYFDNLYFYKGTALSTTKFDKSTLKMYPNPVQNTLTIEANSAIQRVSVYNVLGQELMSRNPKSNSTTLQTSELQKGVYMVKTEIDGKISSSKIVK
jgi:hypothetical protein